MAVVEGVEETRRLGVAGEELPVEPAGQVELLAPPRRRGRHGGRGVRVQRRQAEGVAEADRDAEVGAGRAEAPAQAALEHQGRRQLVAGASGHGRLGRIGAGLLQHAQLGQHEQGRAKEGPVHREAGGPLRLRRGAGLSEVGVTDAFACARIGPQLRVPTPSGTAPDRRRRTRRPAATDRPGAPARAPPALHPPGSAARRGGPRPAPTWCRRLRPARRAAARDPPPRPGARRTRARESSDGAGSRPRPPARTAGRLRPVAIDGQSILRVGRPAFVQVAEVGLGRERRGAEDREGGGPRGRATGDMHVVWSSDEAERPRDESRGTSRVRDLVVAGVWEVRRRSS